MSLQGKVAVIIGAGGGMGQEVVKEFIDKGATIIACDLKTEAVERLLETSANDSAAFQLDITDEVAVERVFLESVERFGKIDILVNIAGIAQQATPIDEITTAEWEKLFAINTTAVFHSCKQAAKVMKKQKSGVIVNVGSISVVRPRPGLSAYVASKGALVAFSKALAIELADHKVRVNVLNPGPTNTGMLSQFAKVDDKTNLSLESFEQSVPLGRLVLPADIASGVTYLCSDEASMVTGMVLNVDGGRGL